MLLHQIEELKRDVLVGHHRREYLAGRERVLRDLCRGSAAELRENDDVKLTYLGIATTAGRDGNGESA